MQQICLTKNELENLKLSTLANICKIKNINTNPLRNTKKDYVDAILINSSTNVSKAVCFACIIGWLFVMISGPLVHLIWTLNQYMELKMMTSRFRWMFEKKFMP